MIRNFEYLTVFTCAPGVLPEQNDRYQIQPWKVNEIKAYKKKSAEGLLMKGREIAIKTGSKRMLQEITSIERENAHSGILSKTNFRNFSYIISGNFCGNFEKKIEEVWRKFFAKILRKYWENFKIISKIC